jgi:hypothetical protein
VLGAALAGCGDGTDDRPPVWEYIAPAILKPNCATVSCHSRAAAAAGLDFSDPERGYKSLTSLWVWIVDPNGTREANCKKVDGQTVCMRNFRPLLVPFNPSQSRLVHMLRARGADRMPPDRPLPEPDIRLIERWILDGAKKDGVNLPTGPATGQDAATAPDAAPGPDATGAADGPPRLDAGAAADTGGNG